MQLKGIAIAPGTALDTAGADSAAVRGMKDLALAIAKIKPHTIVVITPAGHVFSDAVSVDYETKLTGGGLTKECDLGLLDAFNRTVGRDELPVIFINERTAQEYDITRALEANTQSVLKYIDKAYPDYRIVQVTAGGVSVRELLLISKTLREAAELSGHSTVLLAVSPLAAQDKGALYNELVTDALGAQRYLDILTIPMKEVAASGTTGYDPLVLALGAADSIKTTADICHVGAVDGTGVLCAFITYNLEDKDFIIPGFVGAYAKLLKQNKEAMRRAEPDILRLAREAAELWAKDRKRLDYTMFAESISSEETKSRLVNERTGVFVSLYKEGRIRGCMGTVTPATDSLGAEIINNAIEASGYDPRFMPVEPEELADLVYEVDVLGLPEQIEREDELDPHKYGLIAEQGLLRGVLLPDLPGLDTPAEQIAAAKQKAGIAETPQPEDGPVVLLRFTTERFSSEAPAAAKKAPDEQKNS